jgi:hypothetical protein
MVEIVSVPIIVTMVFAVNALLKYTFKNEELNRYIPMVSCLLGALFGVIAFMFVPDVMPTDNGIVAFVLGASSGLTATGFHQMLKQMKK